MVLGLANAIEQGASELGLDRSASEYLMEKFAEGALQGIEGDFEEHM